MRESSPSRTALLIALGVVILGGDSYGRERLPPGALDAQIELLKVTNLLWPLPIFVLCNPIVTKLVRWILHTMHPNLLEGMAFRKCFIDSTLSNFLNRSPESNKQVLILAPGYDTLSIRTRERAAVSWWEIDHPATAVIRRRIKHNKSVNRLELDLTEPTELSHVLSKQREYDSSLPTCVVIEGLLMYLTETQVKNLFLCGAPVVGNDSICVFDHLDWDDRQQRTNLGWISDFAHWVLASGGEPWLWGIQPSRLEAFFESEIDSDWKVVECGHACGLERCAIVRKS